MENINSDIFLTAITNNHIVNDQLITGSIIIGKIALDYPLTVKNCVFEDKFLIKGASFNNGLEFQNCTFKNGLSIINTDFNENLSFQGNKISGRLSFSNTIFQTAHLGEGDYEEIAFYGIIKSSDQTPGQILLENVSCKKLNFSCIELNCSVELKRGFYETVNFEKNKLQQSLSILDENVTIKNFYVTYSEFFDRVGFSKATIEDMFYLSVVTFNGQVVIDKQFSAKSFYLNYVIAKQNFSLKFDANIETLHIHSCEFQNSLNCYFPKIIETEEGLSNLSLTIDGVIKGNLIFEEITIPSISISGVNLGNMFFKKTETHFITITDLYNQGKLSFADLKLVYNYHILVIFDSNINTTEFVNVDFRKFQELVIAKSEVSNMVLSNCIFPSRIQIGTTNPQLGYIIKPDEKINDDTYYKETYRQLKQATEKQGNRAYSLTFRAKEQHYLRRELPWGWDKVVLYLNYISNNHGLSWSRGLIFTLMISWILFIFYEVSLAHPTFYWTMKVSDLTGGFQQGLRSFSNFWVSFPLFKSLETEHTSWKTNLVLMLSRIFMGYGVYQTIMAFRKFVLK